MTLANAEKLRLKRADVLESKKTGFETVKHLHGNVQFQKGNIKLNCQKSIYKERRDIAYLFNQVKMVKDDLILECDSVTFYSKKNKLESNGNPTIHDPDYKLVADSLIYFTELDSGVALGNVELIQNDQKIKADRIEYVKSPGSNAISYIAIGNVEIIDTLRIATCGFANYNNITGKTILDRKPKIIDETRTIVGEQIILQYDKKSLNRILIPKNAKISSITEGFDGIKRDSSHTIFEHNDDMTSKRLDGFFIDGLLDSLRLVGMASTTYHIFEDSLYKGKNITSGDTITMKFYNKELNNIIVSGGAQGKYIPDTKANDSSFPLIYSADKLDYFLEDENTNLLGNAQTSHDNTDLKAGFIKVNTNTSVLKCERDVGYVVDAYLKDLRYGGNETVINNIKYIIKH